MHHAPESQRPLVGVSSCLLGERVRYDGRDRLDPYIVQSLERFFDFVPLCPEVGAGLGVPRPPVHLVGKGATPRAVGVTDPALDVTRALEEFSLTAVKALPPVDGFILKRGSPSCGIAGVPVTGPEGITGGQGIFARILAELRPLLPVIDEARLAIPEEREGFAEGVFAHRRWRHLVESGVDGAALERFHARHKLLLMAHGVSEYRRLGRLVANRAGLPLEEVVEEYAAGLMAALTRPASRGAHVNVLEHIAGYLKRELTPDDKAELRESFEAFRHGQLPLAAPLTLLRHHLRRHPRPYLAQQLYLYPGPAPL